MTDEFRKNLELHMGVFPYMGLSEESKAAIEEAYKTLGLERFESTDAMLLANVLSKVSIDGYRQGQDDLKKLVTGRT